MHRRDSASLRAGPASGDVEVAPDEPIVAEAIARCALTGAESDRAGRGCGPFEFGRLRAQYLISPAWSLLIEVGVRAAV